MPTDLENLPGYPGHDQAQAFIEDCVRDIPEDAQSDALTLRAELNVRVRPSTAARHVQAVYQR